MFQISKPYRAVSQETIKVNKHTISPVLFDISSHLNPEPQPPIIGPHHNGPTNTDSSPDISMSILHNPKANITNIPIPDTNRPTCLPDTNKATFSNSDMYPLVNTIPSPIKPTTKQPTTDQPDTNKPTAQQAYMLKPFIPNNDNPNNNTPKLDAIKQSTTPKPDTY
ncbi:hypothetical protein Salat_2892600 [Sesamum alatum]|uniref:Uncharacterized protein n=1 Tax=Sesamum alatum TaxID=300844 RepID=A0AAE1XI92_9LAMI|nr:hypothetical protein Salat_2892600 [Sesamum alatum]